ncbi:MAG: tryptophan synthase subunit alpha [Bacteroidota bacterium]|nr:tryptophan synthase subunit alpha [Bacteroidota bacterium]
MDNRINTLFRNKKNEVLSVYFTAGFPKLDDTLKILRSLQWAGVDMVEIGIPFSDPVADGPVIQESNKKALDNGMTLKNLFSQLEDFRKNIKIPVVLMGYFNTIFQFGVESFCRQCAETGIDGVIIPDLPAGEFISKYKPLFDRNNIKNIFMITPQTSDERIKMFDSVSDGFLYVVSSSKTTGTNLISDDFSKRYFEKIKKIKLSNPTMVGFGIHDKESFEIASKYANGAIIGSAYIKAIAETKTFRNTTTEFIYKIRPKAN